MKIAIEGCCHGELDKIYSTIQHIEKTNGTSIDLLIICGDFQAIRNRNDLSSMAVPDKYLVLGTFWKYYAGIEKAPVLTLFIGGNHESSNYMCELPYGGWVAPNIYYMGYANVINFGGIRIAGLSGIYKSQDYYKGHYELPPFGPGDKHSVYHVRDLEIFRLSQIKQPIDIMVTHDWPTGIWNQADCSELLRFKPFLRNELESNTLGSPETGRLLKQLKPRYWFAAHLHVKFACIYEHDSSTKTKFLSLDKCLPHRKFLQVIDIDTKETNSKSLMLDVEWMCILKKTDHLLSINHYNQAPIEAKIEINEKDFEEIREDFQDCLEIPSNFRKTAPEHSEEGEIEVRDVYLNDQTTLYCEMLNLRDPIRLLLEKRGNSNIVNESKTQLYNDLLDADDDDNGDDNCENDANKDKNDNNDDEQKSDEANNE